MINEKIEIEIIEEEKWWGGNIYHGFQMPYSEFKQELLGNNDYNQSMPLLLSSHGRIIYSENPFTFEFKDSVITITNFFSEIIFRKVGETLKEAHKYFIKNFTSSTNTIPDELLFTKPQYNTWIELMYNQNEEDILSYAEKWLEAGYSPGVLMIDDTWQDQYGLWDFCPSKFKNPKKMIDKLHNLGFKVMLWVCPFVSADSFEGRKLAREGAIIMDNSDLDNIMWSDTQNKGATIRWWNGVSYCLDFSNEKAIKWFKDRLDYLQNEYGVDGFKFDAGDSHFYNNPNYVFHKNWHANDHMESFAKFGLDYRLNELRACWKLANKPIVQRLCDKRHNWDDLQQLIPGIIAQGLVGYYYSCPDMIGGGEYQSFLSLDSVDQELFVRSAQLSSLMPMMQFSAAPYRVLSKENQEYCLQASNIHLEYGEEILSLAKSSAITGEPIVRSLEYNYPNNNYSMINDQFMLGDNILVIPVVKKCQYSREAYIPIGLWERQDLKQIIQGPCKIYLETPLSNLCWFRKV